MNDEVLKKITSIGESFRRLNKKVKLLCLLNKAKLEYEQNKLVDCENTCREVLKKESENAIALRGLGCIMQSRGDALKALEYYFQALENSSNKEIEYTLIGTVYYNENKFDEAIKYYNLAIDVNDNYDLAYDGKNQSILENHLQILDMQDSLIKRNMFK